MLFISHRTDAIYRVSAVIFGYLPSLSFSGVPNHAHGQLKTTLKERIYIVSQSRQAKDGV
jgi:hypothetical protein